MRKQNKYSRGFEKHMGLHPEDLFDFEVFPKPCVEKFPNWFWETIQLANCDSEKFADLLREFDQLKLFKMYILFQEADRAILAKEHTDHLQNYYDFWDDDYGTDYTLSIVSRGKELYFKARECPMNLPVPDMEKDETLNIFEEVVNVYVELYEAPVRERGETPPDIYELADYYREFIDPTLRG